MPTGTAVHIIEQITDDEVLCASCGWARREQ